MIQVGPTATELEDLLQRLDELQSSIYNKDISKSAALIGEIRSELSYHLGRAENVERCSGGKR